jgi:hypothetical protein
MARRHPFWRRDFFATNFPRHGGSDVAGNDAKECGAVPSNNGAKTHDAVLWVHFCNCFRQGSIRKNLSKKDQFAKNLLLDSTDRVSGSAVQSIYQGARTGSATKGEGMNRTGTGGGPE